MKRFSLCLFMLVGMVLATQAVAGRWVTKEIRWQISSQGSPRSATAIHIRDTLRTSLGPVDTTASFDLDEATIPRGMAGPASPVIGGVNGVSAGSDSVVVAYVVVQPDTSVDLTPAFTSMRMFVDGRVGGYGATTNLAAGWVVADSALVNGAAGGTMLLGDDTVAFPIRSISPYGNIRRFGQLRARITGLGGATGIPAARVFLRYYTESR